MAIWCGRPNGYLQQVPQVSIAQTNLKIMLKFCEQFGLTPSARSRMVGEENGAEKETDEMELLLRGVTSLAFVYKPSAFMLPDSHYDKAKADRAVAFIENLCHTKGKWAGKAFPAPAVAGTDCA
jgi:hypothetical protein